MAKKIADMKTIDSGSAQKLAAAGIATFDQLLEKGASSKGRQELVASTGIEKERILRWVNMADLCRISGVGERYSDLLEAAGVDTVKELKHRKPENLHAKMAEVNQQQKLVRQDNLPELALVENWVAQAKELEPKVTY